MSQDQGQPWSQTTHQQSQQEQAWARWEYTPDEWMQLDRLDWGRTVQRYWLTVGPGMLGLLASIALFLWARMASDVITVVALIAMASFLLLLIILLVVGNGSVSRPKKRHQARKNASQPHTVTLSGKGMWQAGVFFPLERLWGDIHEWRVMLHEVYLSTQPTMLHFRVEHDVTSYKVGSDGHNYKSNYSVLETIPLLVPHAHESEAEQLVHRFRTEVIEVRERENERKRAAQEARMHPPEPR